MAKTSLAIQPSDIVFPKRRGFARLKRAKLLEISKAASKRGASKGGRSYATRMANLQKSNFFKKLKKPFPKIKSERVKLADAAQFFGLSRQAFRRWVKKFKVPSKRIRTSTTFAVSALYDLRRRLRIDLATGWH